MSSILTVRDLVTEFATQAGWVRAVDGVSLTVPAGGTLGVVGESGCGKSATARSILQLDDARSTRYIGEVLYDGVDLLTLGGSEMRRYRGAEISMIFQDPTTALDPVYKIGSQMVETLKLHSGERGSRARDIAAEMLRRVGIPAPKQRLDAYPHELSGGMRQRVVIAMALMSNPKLLIADEPTTALDMTTQAQILELLADLQRDLGMAMILITHDLGLVRAVCEEVAIMYAGKVVEFGPTQEVFDGPQHPYTGGLMTSVPARDTHRSRGRLAVIPGRVPSLLTKPHGCDFEPRCGLSSDVCRDSEPPLEQHGTSQWARCWHAGEWEPPGAVGYRGRQGGA